MIRVKKFTNKVFVTFFNRVLVQRPRWFSCVSAPLPLFVLMANQLFFFTNPNKSLVVAIPAWGLLFILIALLFLHAHQAVVFLP